MKNPGRIETITIGNPRTSMLCSIHDHTDCKNTSGMCECQCHYSKDSIPEPRVVHFISTKCRNSYHNECKGYRLGSRHQTTCRCSCHSETES